jgi:S-adenosylmethionine synthetase
LVGNCAVLSRWCSTSCVKQGLASPKGLQLAYAIGCQRVVVAYGMLCVHLQSHECLTLEPPFKMQ